jgi:hypothetical protein
MLSSQAQQFTDFGRFQVFAVCDRQTLQPKLRGAGTFVDMDMGGFMAFVRKEVEPVSSDPEDGRHRGYRFSIPGNPSKQGSSAAWNMC